MSSTCRPRVLFALLGALSLAVPVSARADGAGAYLASRSADYASDFLAAQEYMTRALSADPSHEGLMDGLILADVGAGNVAGAIPVARRLVSLGNKAQLAVLLLMIDQLQREDYAGVLKDLEAGNRLAGPLLDQVITGWVHLGNGSMGQAIAAFEKLNETPGLAAFGQYHKAMALAMAGDFEAAEALFADPESGLMGLRRATFARVQVLSQLERFDEALAVLAENFGTEADPELDTMRARLAAAEALPFDMVRNVKDGLAEAFYVLGAVLQSEAAGAQTLIHSRMAEFLRPDHIDAILLSGAVLDSLDQWQLAIRNYEKVKPDHGAYLAAQTAKVQSLYRLGRTEEAVKAMTDLAAREGKYASVHISLGDLLRREKRFLEAAEAYGKAISLIANPEDVHWGLFYARGIAFEQGNKFDEAVVDFRKALELNPNQPDVLNYLGYSLLDRNRDIEEAVRMIQTAMRLRPEEGHIIDSLAWGYFLIGRYSDALHAIEQASLLMPVDPVVTDHLGDIYWAVGRKLEARFQWRRALSFAPLEKDAERIRKKLDLGLDEVLAAEGAVPLQDRLLPPKVKSTTP